MDSAGLDIKHTTRSHFAHMLEKVQSGGNNPAGKPGELMPTEHLYCPSI